MSVDEYKIIIIVSVAAIAILLLLLFVFFASGKKKRITNQGSRDSERLIAQRSQQLNQLIKSLDVLMDEVEGAINAALQKAENKENRLKELIRQADIRLTKLERIQAGSAPAKSLSVATRAYVENTIAPASTEASINGANIEPAPSKSKSKKYDQVAELISKGMTQEQIAKELKIDKGEVELISNLQKKMS